MATQGKDSFMVGDAITIVGAPYKGRITGICEDMPAAPFLVSLIDLRDETRKKLWRFSIDGMYTPNHSTARLKKEIRASQISNSNIGT